MTPREWILKCLDDGIRASTLREEKRQEAMRRWPGGRVVKKRGTGRSVTVPHPPPKPIGCTLKKIFGAAKKRPAGYDIGRLEAALKELCADGTLGFTSGVWWRR